MKMMHLQSAQNNLWKREQRTKGGCTLHFLMSLKFAFFAQLAFTVLIITITILLHFKAIDSTIGHPKYD